MKLIWRISIGLGIVGFLICALILIALYKFTRDDISVPPPRSIAHTQSSKPIYLDVTVDDKQIIHLLWYSEREKLVYQKSKDRGDTWSDPVTVYLNDQQIRLLRPQILSHENAVSVYWSYRGLNQRISTDNGSTWSSAEKIFSQGLRFKLLSDKNIIYAVYSKTDGTYFTKSNDIGINWTFRKRIGPRFEFKAGANPYSIAASDSMLYVVFSSYSEQYNQPLTKGSGRAPSGQFSPAFYYLRGDTSGNAWEEARRVDMSQNRLYSSSFSPIRYPAANELNGLLTVIFRQAALYFTTSNDNGDSWTAPDIIIKTPVRVFAAQPADEKVYVFWVDDRHQKRSWWSYIPFFYFFALDADISWINNDLYYACIENYEVKSKKRITPPLSYVETRHNTLASIQLDDRVIVFWSGKRKVGKNIESVKAPYDVFIKVLNIK